MITLTAATDPSLSRALCLLDNDLEAMGWDRPARLYTIWGPGGDVRLDLIDGAIEGHPADWMRGAISAHSGRPALPEPALGVALAVEAWRHPHLDDLRARNPQAHEQALRELADAGLGARQAEEFLEERVEALNAFFAPSEHPMRLEIRSVLAVLRDGTGLAVSRDRGGEPQVTETLPRGPLVDLLHGLMTGVLPTAT